MGFRNPINGIPPSAITEDMLADGSVSGTKLTADAIDGKTITGATLRTAAAGERVVVRPDGGAGVIEFFTGDAAELTPATVDPAFDDDLVPSISVRSGTSTGRTVAGALLLTPGTAASGVGAAELDANLFVVGRVEAEGTRSLEAGRTANQTIGNAAWETVSWQNAGMVAANGAGVPASLKRGFTESFPITTLALSPGRYLIDATCVFAGNTTGRRGIRLRVTNGATTRTALEREFPNHSSATPLSVFFATVVEVPPPINLGDDVSIQIQVWQNSGGNLAVVPAGTRLTVTQLP